MAIRQPGPIIPHRAVRTWLPAFLLTVMLLAACAPPYMEQPGSPLPPGTDPALVSTNWQVTEVEQDGILIEIDALQPLYARFSQAGRLSLETVWCIVAPRWNITFEPDGSYRLANPGGTVPAVSCGELVDAQKAAVGNAIGETHQMAFEGEKLVLLGDAIRVVLEPAEVYPYFPDSEREVIITPWRWVAAGDRGTMLGLSALPTIVVTFLPGGKGVRVIAGECLSASYDLVALDPTTFTLELTDLQIGECGDCATAQSVWATSVLQQATQ